MVLQWPSLKAIFFIVFVLWAFSLSEAQVVEVPTSADPARIQSDTRKQPPARQETPAIEIHATPPAAIVVPPGAILKRIRLDGAVTYTEDSLAGAWNDLLSRTVSENDLKTIADNITRIYQSNGYLLSRARFISFEKKTGTARFEVIEGYASEIRFIGKVKERYMRRLRGYGDKILRERPLTAATMERYLYLMDDVPGITTSVDLQITFDRPGAILEIEVKYAPLNLAANVNNRGNKFVGPLRAMVGGRVNNLTGFAESIGFNIVTTPADSKELRYGEVLLRKVIGGEGTQVNIGASFSEVIPDIDLPEPFEEVIGRGRVASIAIRHPVVRSRANNLSVVVGYNDEHTRAVVTFPSQEFVLFDEKIRSVVLGISSRFAVGRSDLTAAVSAAGGLGRDSSVGSSDESLPPRSRDDGRTDFAKANSSFSYRQRLDRAGQWSFFFSVDGQYGLKPLLASEEFGLGGAESVRALNASEFSGDSGIAGTLELRYEPNLFSAVNTQVYGFYDSGRVWNRGGHPGQSENDRASAAGGGFRFRFKEFGDGYIEAAAPTDVSKSDVSRSTRVFVGMTGRY